MSQFNLSIVGKPVGIKTSHRKENKCYFSSMQVAYIKDGQIKVFADCRFYSTTGNTWTCCLWVKTPNDWRAGSGRAEGYGYRQSNASFAVALLNCGYAYTGHGLSGAGDSAIRECLIELAELHGITGATVIESHP